MRNVFEVQREVNAHGNEAGQRRGREPSRENTEERLAFDRVDALDEPYAYHRTDHGLRCGYRDPDDREEMYGEPLSQDHLQGRKKVQPHQLGTHRLHHPPAVSQHSRGNAQPADQGRLKNGQRSGPDKYRRRKSEGKTEGSGLHS